MKENRISILGCPVCRGGLKGDHVGGLGNDKLQGNLICEECGAMYPVRQGIPRLYLSDDSIIERSDQSTHSEYILNRQRIKLLAAKTRKRSNEPTPGFFYKRISVLAIGGWMALVLSSLLIMAGAFESESSAEHWIWIVVLALIAGTLFLVDFWLYRNVAKAKYDYQVNRLAELSESSVLSEFDIHQKRQNKMEAHFDFSEDQPKAEEIASRLDKYAANGQMGLNVGCGGEQHQLISKQFFDRGYDMVGVDICEDYLLEYESLFETSAIHANALALPFKDGCFNVVNFCDVLEHLHHPLLGLQEVNRVLKDGGIVILATNYRCRLSRECANPLILLERIISLYVDHVLGPRDMLRRFSDMEFYHLNFSKREIIQLLKSSGFEILEFYTYLYKRRMLSKLFSRLPVLRFMGDAILVTCRKRVQ